MACEKTIALYPDLAAVGGLAAALRFALQAMKSPSEVTALPKEHRFVAYARVERGVRASQVYIAADERLFLNDFWRDGVNFGNGCTPQLAETARSIHEWIANECSIERLISAFDFVKLSDAAWSYDRGTEVEDRWRLYLDHVGFPELAAIVAEAATRPELRQLFPYTSLNRSCFGRCTGYPFTRDTPHVEPAAGGVYNVLGPDGRLLGHGDAKAAADILVANLPSHCGSAVRGTAATLDST
jgi:hypothetical protein